MAIAAKRFSMLNDETNIGVSGFGSAADTSILNSPINDLPAPTATLDELIQSAVERNAAEEASETAFEKATRYTKDGASSIMDMTKLPASARSEFLNKMSGGNPQFAKTFDGMMGKCSGAGRGFGTGMNGRMPNASMNCGGGSVSLGRGGSTGSSCSASSFGDLLNKLTGGLFGGAFKDVASLLQALMALSGYGYNLGMCGVFGSLQGSPMAAGLSNMDLSRASGSLLGTLGMGGNTRGFLDVAKSSTGLSPMLSNPSAISGFFDNFTFPGGTKETGMCMMSDVSMEGADSLDNYWDSSAYDDMASISEMNNYSEDLDTAFLAKNTDRSFNADNLDAIPASSDDFTRGAYNTSSWDSPDVTVYSNLGGKAATSMSLW